VIAVATTLMPACQDKMDCIDHSTSTTRLLSCSNARGYLRWHRGH
jgi:hypothetical protein